MLSSGVKSQEYFDLPARLRPAGPRVPSKSLLLHYSSPCPEGDRRELSLSPLESTLTYFFVLSFLDSTLTRKHGGGGYPPLLSMLVQFGRGIASYAPRATTYPSRAAKQLARATPAGGRRRTVRFGGARSCGWRDSGRRRRGGSRTTSPVRRCPPSWRGPLRQCVFRAELP